MDTSTLFADKSDLYAAARPTYPPALFTYIASLVEQHERAWDCATGNGQAAVSLAQHFKHVDATDISDNQIANRFEHDNVIYGVCPAEKPPFPDNYFDVVNVAQALHWFDFGRYWQAVKRVLKPNGVFVTSTYSWMTITPEIDAIVEQTVKQTIAPYWAANNRLCWDGYRSLEFPFERIERSEMTMVNVWTLAQYFDYLHTWSATRRCMDALGTAFFEEAKREVAAVWGDRPRDVLTPLSIVACRTHQR